LRDETIEQFDVFSILQKAIRLCRSIQLVERAFGFVICITQLLFAAIHSTAWFEGTNAPGNKVSNRCSIAHDVKTLRMSTTSTTIDAFDQIAVDFSKSAPFALPRVGSVIGIEVQWLLIRGVEKLLNSRNILYFAIRIK
jgi:hypothetical protein